MWLQEMDKHRSNGVQEQGMKEDSGEEYQHHHHHQQQQQHPTAPAAWQGMAAVPAAAVPHMSYMMGGQRQGHQFVNEATQPLLVSQWQENENEYLNEQEYRRKERRRRCRACVGRTSCVLLAAIFISLLFFFMARPPFLGEIDPSVGIHGIKVEMDKITGTVPYI